MGTSHEAQQATKTGVKKAMEMFRADSTLAKEHISQTTGLDLDVTVRAMKLAAAGIKPEEMSALGTVRACKLHNLPRMLKTIIEGTDTEFEKRKSYTLDPKRGYKERDSLRQKMQKAGDTIPLARDLGKDYCAMTKGLPVEMDKGGIIDTRVFMDLKSGAYFRRTVRLVIEIDPIGTSSNLNTMKEIFDRQ